MSNLVDSIFQWKFRNTVNIECGYFLTFELSSDPLSSFALRKTVSVIWMQSVIRMFLWSGCSSFCFSRFARWTCSKFVHIGKSNWASDLQSVNDAIKFELWMLHFTFPKVVLSSKFWKVIVFIVCRLFFIFVHIYIFQFSQSYNH